MIKTAKRILILAGCLLLAACNATTSTRSAEVVATNPLRVGVTTIYPPMIFRLRKSIVGIEADLARELGNALGRPVEFVELSWDAQIPSLLQGKIDIIMSSMTATDSRRVRIDFCDPYLGVGLSGLMRSDDYQRARNEGRTIPTSANVGAQSGTVGEVFARQWFPADRIVPVLKPDNAPFQLRRKSIDIFITDSPTAIWLASENEGELSEAPLDSAVEYLAWGVRKEDYALRDQINFILTGWRADGTLQQTITGWLGGNFQMIEP